MNSTPHGADGPAAPPRTAAPARPRECADAPAGPPNWPAWTDLNVFLGVRRDGTLVHVPCGNLDLDRFDDCGAEPAKGGRS